MANGLSTTTNVAAGTVSTVALAKWALACIVSGHLTMPDDTTLLIMCSALMPVGHAFYLACAAAFAAWFKRKTGIDLPDLTASQAGTPAIGTITKLLLLGVVTFGLVACTALGAPPNLARDCAAQGVL